MRGSYRWEKFEGVGGAVIVWTKVVESVTLAELALERPQKILLGKGLCCADTVCQTEHLCIIAPTSGPHRGILRQNILS